MQKEHLVVKNFFTLKDIDIDLAKINIFIGEQASGKSLLIKLLYYFRQILVSNGFFFSKNLQTLSEDLYSQFNYIFNNISSSSAEIIYSYGKYSITINVKSKKVIFSDNLVEMYYQQIDRFLDNLSASVSHAMHGFPRLENNNEITLINAIDTDKVRDVLKYKCTFFPAGRVSFFTLFNNLFNLIGNNQQLNLNPLMIEFGRDYQHAFSEFRNVKDINKLNLFEKYAARILKGKYIYNSLGGYIKQNGLHTKLINASSGQQEFLPIYIILRDILSSYSSNLYVEEPEAHLYPTAQKDIIELLVYVTKVTNSDGLYITTHSPYILTVLNNLILANEVKNKKLSIEPNLLVPFEDVQAYFIAGGKARSLMNKEYCLIDALDLDDVSNQINSQYSEMVDLL